MKTLIVAPHPDDELLGVGGTLLRRKAEGAEIAWLIVTGLSSKEGWEEVRVKQREMEISKVTELVGFDRVYNLQLPTTRLDQFPASDLVEKFSAVFRDFAPEEIFIPSRSDVHSDHRVVFDTVAACVKWFRYPSVRRVLAYETISETEFGLSQENVFTPNYFIDITQFLDQKLEILNVYASELGYFPFPRSHEALRALATLRGSTAGFESAEAFQLLRERQ